MSAIDILLEYLQHTIISTIDHYISSFYVPKSYEWHNFIGYLHRIYHPAQIIYQREGGWIEKWYKNGRLHNIYGAAVILYYKSGQIKRKEYVIDYNRHRINQPAIIRYYENGQVYKEQWFHQGQRHRVKDPAIIIYSPTGQIITSRWYLFGEEIVDYENFMD